MAHNYGSTSNGLLWGIVADYFQLLGCPAIARMFMKGSYSEALCGEYRDDGLGSLVR